jgi:anti-sigma regulatory factor (Ser/Thr protein kinase)
MVLNGDIHRPAGSSSVRPTRHRIVLKPDLSLVSGARRFLADLAAADGFNEDRRQDIVLVTTEAVVNAMEHSPSEADVAVEVLSFSDRLEVHVTGQGEFKVRGGTPGREHRGLGLPLMVVLSDGVYLRSAPHSGTHVCLVFNRVGAPSLPGSEAESTVESSRHALER